MIPDVEPEPCFDYVRLVANVSQVNPKH